MDCTRPKVNEFQEKWSNFTGAKHSIAVTSCTSAMHISLAAAGFKSGDEAIVPAFTWISTANVVEHLGGKAVFVTLIWIHLILVLIRSNLKLPKKLGPSFQYIFLVYQLIWSQYWNWQKNIT